MKSLGRIVIGCILLISLGSCINGERRNAEKRVSDYKEFVDSIQVITTQKVVKRWDTIQYQNDLKKLNAEIAVSKISNKETIEKELNEATIQFELFKSKILVEQEKIKLEQIKP